MGGTQRSEGVMGGLGEQGARKRRSKAVSREKCPLIGDHVDK